MRVASLAPLIELVPTYTSVHPVWHHTSREGLTGILRSRGFWAPSSAQLDDQREVVHGCFLAKEVWSARRLGQPDCRARDFMDYFILDDELKRVLENNFYVFCATSEDDCFREWRTRPGNGQLGYAIGLNPASRLKTRVPHDLLPGGEVHARAGSPAGERWYEVLYDVKDQYHRMRKMQSRLFGVLLEMSEYNDNYNDQAFIATTWLATLVAVMKDEAAARENWAEEREVRYLAPLPILFDERWTAKAENLGLYSHTQSISQARAHGFAAPVMPETVGGNAHYVLEDESNGTSMVRIRVGPTGEPERRVEEVLALQHALGIHPLIPVDVSRRLTS